MTSHFLSWRWLWTSVSLHMPLWKPLSFLFDIPHLTSKCCFSPCALQVMLKSTRQVDFSLHLASLLHIFLLSFFFFNKCLSHELIKKLFFIFSPAQSTFNLTSSWCNSLHHQALLRTDSEISPGWMTSSRFLTDLHPCVFFHSSL